MCKTSFCEICGLLSHKISFYYTVDCKPRIAVSLVIKIRDGHIREISEPREGEGAEYFLVESSYACRKIRIRPKWPWLSLYWNLRTPYIRSPEGEGVLSSEGGSCACRKIRISGSGSIWPLRHTMQTQEVGGVVSCKGGQICLSKNIGLPSWTPKWHQNLHLTPPPFV